MHFEKYRATANGLSGSGAGAGCFLLPNLIRYTMNNYGLSGCLLILGGVMLNVCMCALLFRPFSFWKCKHSENSTVSNDNTVQNALTTEKPLLYINPTEPSTEVEKSLMLRYFDIQENNNVYSKGMNLLGQNQTHLVYDVQNVASSLPCLKANARSKTPVSKADSLQHLNDEPDNSFIHKLDNSELIYMSIESIPSLSPHLQTTHTPPTTGKVKKSKHKLEWSILKNTVFLNIAFAIFTGVFAQFSLFNFLPSVMEERGFPDQYGAYIVAILGICDLCGRIMSGCIADLNLVERKSVFQTNLLLLSCFEFIIPNLTSFPAMCVVVGFSGLFSGGFIGIQVAVVADKVGIETLSSSYGFAMFFASIALLINPPLAGEISYQCHMKLNMINRDEEVSPTLYVTVFKLILNI